MILFFKFVNLDENRFNYAIFNEGSYFDLIIDFLFLFSYACKSAVEFLILTSSFVLILSLISFDVSIFSAVEIRDLNFFGFSKVEKLVLIGISWSSDDEYFFSINYFSAFRVLILTGLSDLLLIGIKY